MLLLCSSRTNPTAIRALANLHPLLPSASAPSTPRRPRPLSTLPLAREQKKGKKAKPLARPCGQALPDWLWPRSCHARLPQLRPAALSPRFPGPSLTKCGSGYTVQYSSVQPWPQRLYLSYYLHGRTSTSSSRPPAAFSSPLAPFKHTQPRDRRDWRRRIQIQIQNSTANPVPLGALIRLSTIRRAVVLG